MVVNRPLNSGYANEEGSGIYFWEVIIALGVIVALFWDKFLALIGKF